MKLTAATIGSLGPIMAKEVSAGEKAATAAARRAGDGLKAALANANHRRRPRDEAGHDDP